MAGCGEPPVARASAGRALGSGAGRGAERGRAQPLLMTGPGRRFLDGRGSGMFTARRPEVSACALEGRVVDEALLGERRSSASPVRTVVWSLPLLGEMRSVAEGAWPRTTRRRIRSVRAGPSAVAEPSPFSGGPRQPTSRARPAPCAPGRSMLAASARGSKRRAMLVRDRDRASASRATRVFRRARPVIDRDRRDRKRRANRGIRITWWASAWQAGGTRETAEKKAVRSA